MSTGGKGKDQEVVVPWRGQSPSQGVPEQRVSVEMPMAIAGNESRGRGGWRVGAATWPW